jgi:hypothetical protein
MDLYCEDDSLADFLLEHHRLSLEEREDKIQKFLAKFASSGQSPA